MAKFILTMIAVGIFGLNYHLFGGDIISKANASHKVEYNGNTSGTASNHIWIDNWPSNCN